jgi:hypothetical protein
MSSWKIGRCHEIESVDRISKVILRCSPIMIVLGRVDENGVLTRRNELPAESGLHQKSLFDDD